MVGKRWSHRMYCAQDKPGWCVLGCLQMLLLHFLGRHPRQGDLAEESLTTTSRGTHMGPAAACLVSRGLKVRMHAHPEMRWSDERVKVTWAPLSLAVIERSLALGRLCCVSVLAGKLWDEAGIDQTARHAVLVTAVSRRYVTVVDPNPWVGFGGARRLTHRKFLAAFVPAGQMGMIVWK